MAAAEGWIGLGNLPEAEAELDQVAERWRGHPDVLKVRLFLRYHARDWPACVAAGRGLTAGAPALSWAWVFYANSLYFDGRAQEAYDALLPVMERFPENWEMRYNIGCYACQLGRHEEALQWLVKAMGLGDAKHIKEVALLDADFLPVRGQIPALEPPPPPEGPGKQKGPGPSDPAL